MNTLVLLALLAAGPSWQDQTLTLINEERVAANERELALYGAIEKVRHPLQADPRLADSAQWWCNALRGTGDFGHFGFLSERGFLLGLGGKEVSRVWLPTYQPDRLHYWAFRNQYLGIEGSSTQNSSENGVLLKRASPENIVSAWVRSGWHVDPRQAAKHYSNLVNPNWTHFGVAKQGWAAGKTSVFGEFHYFSEGE